MALSRDIPEDARRIRAARNYAGLSREGLGEAIGLSGATIGRWERGERSDEIEDVYRRAIAEACELPYAFFTLDFSQLAEAPPTTIAALEHRVAQLEQLVADAQRETATRFRELAESTAGHTAAPGGAAPGTHRASNG